MDEELAVKVRSLSKSFRLPHQKKDSLKSVFVNIFKKKTRFEHQEVLKNINFDVKRGEFLGIVGRNGGGKSTILKLLAQIYQPDSGSIEINGQLTPFIELGVGFNPELTGRENVYLNGALLGFDNKAMDSMYDDIVAFAELERFMDQKLKNYSSGMQVRLAFSVAIKARTDILLIDEVLAVGDANFQKKCFDVFDQFKEEKRTVIFISHSMGQVIKFCDRVILLDKGRVIADDLPEVVAAEYNMLNDDSQKNRIGRIQISNPREARIAEAVMANFQEGDSLIEIAQVSDRNKKIINSLGFKLKGVSSDMELQKISKPQDIKGVLILDNGSSLNLKLIDDIFSSTKDRLIAVERVYVHMPFDIYQSYMDKRRGPYDHLSKPLYVGKVSDVLRKYNFEVVHQELYGLDEDYQYVEMVYEKIDSNRQENLWG